MDRRTKMILWAFGVGLLSVIFIEVFRPKPVNWQSSYTSTDKIPLGCFILYEELESLYDLPVRKVMEDPYEFLVKNNFKEKSAYIFINTHFSFDKRQSEKLLEFVEDGNTILISAHKLEGALADTLDISSVIQYSFQSEEIQTSLYNKKLSKDSLWKLKKGVYPSYLSKVDTLESSALGFYHYSDSSENLMNFVSVRRGKGEFLIHTLPEAFTNYYMLKHDGNYASQVLSYLAPSEVYWDEYLKAGKVVITSPMRYVLSQEALIWAYYLLLSGLLIFVIFRGKREQRIIPVVKPLENSSVEFAKTLSVLYLEHGDFSNIIAKKINFFLENIRSKFYLNTENLSQDFIKNLASKSGNTEEKTSELIEYIIHLKGKSIHSEEDLIELNRKIEEFNL